jgi:hypothetical protein
VYHLKSFRIFIAFNLSKKSGIISPLGAATTALNI